MDVMSIAKSINKKWKEDVLTDGSIIPECEKISLGSLAADFALAGGIPLKNISVFSGVEHSGKSLSAALCMAEYQKKYPDNVCIWIDVEQNFASQKNFFVKMTGLDISEKRFLRYDCSGKSAEEIFADMIELQQAENIGLIVVDSVAAMVTSTDLDNEFTKDGGLRSSLGKILGKGLREMIMYLPKRDNALILINQVREIGKTFTGATIFGEGGGHAVRFYPAVKVRFGSRVYMKDGVELSGNKGEDANGFRLRFSITKNRLADTTRGGGFCSFTYTNGIDKVNDTLEVALKFGYINRPNNQTYELIDLNTGEIYVDDEGNTLKFRGKQNMVDYLNTHEEFKNKYTKMLSDYIAGANIKSLLDEEALKEINDQEDSVEGNLSKEDSE